LRFDWIVSGTEEPSPYNNTQGSMVADESQDPIEILAMTPGARPSSQQGPVPSIHTVPQMIHIADSVSTYTGRTYYFFA
jgi:hypothetical protein